LPTPLKFANRIASIRAVLFTSLMPEEIACKRDDPNKRRLRWWPLLVVLFLTCAALGAIRFWPEFSHQERNLLSLQTLLVAVFLIICWTLFLSRARWRSRLLVFSMIAGCLGLAAGLFRVRGVSGDMLPILEWRFKAARNEAIADQPAPALGLIPPQGEAAITNSYPQFLGPDRDGTVQAPPLARDWTVQPPALLWRRPVGAGWSGFAVSGGLAVTQEQRAGQEQVVCYDLFSGQVLWTHSDTARYATVIAGEGPRATPTISGDRVYTMGATGIMNCLELASGQIVWTKDLVQENQGRVAEWGISCSPLLTGDFVVATTGAKQGSLAAYHRATGERVWVAGEDQSSYSSPGLGNLDGSRQIYVLNARTVTGHDPVTGALLWSHPWPGGHPRATTPLVLEQDRLLVSSGYGIGSELLELKQDEQGQWNVRRLWKSIRLKSKFANLIHWEGFIYGLDDGIMVCLDPATGQLRWKDGRYGHGQMILTSGLILLTAENGDVVLIDPVPEQLRELSRFSAMNAKTWNPPALAGAYLLVRNDREAACYLLPLARQPD
jgi:outer membrane protein assembly factor BamB